jgi:hypothetical protein
MPSLGVKQLPEGGLIGFIVFNNQNTNLSHGVSLT